MCLVCVGADRFVLQLSPIPTVIYIQKVVLAHIKI